MARVLPDLLNFGGREFETVLEEYDPDTYSSTPPSDFISAEEPFGIDIAYDFSTGDVKGTVGGNLNVVDETVALIQWCAFALLTRRGEYLIYGEDFGGTIHELLGQLPEDQMRTEIPTRVREALLVHERIIDVKNFRFATLPSGTLEVTFDVVTDDEESFRFEGLTVG